MSYQAIHLRQALGLIRALRRLPLSFLPVLMTDALRAGLLTLWSAARQLLAADVHARLGRIRAPVLLIWGEHDRLIPLEIGRELQRILHNPPLIGIPGAGHKPDVGSP
ncbi:MAG: hypothetical protein KatS3mg057_2395 [Herpetosiphonaceae bacterium]|nr:MAG: hypothetical protein KatS3mg057_2395 [Herpetosiphonaceae bacterium]